jgi:hypothetical protein
MTEYEKAMLKLKLLELTQRQTILAIQAQGNPTTVELVQDCKSMLDAAVTSTRKLL